MRTYTLKEVSKKINVSSGIIRQWEKDLEGLLVIPRTKQGARFYSKNEINQLMEIQQLYASHLGKDAIREAYEKKFLAGNEAVGEKSSQAPFSVLEEEETSEAHFPVSEGEESFEAPFPVAEIEEASEAHFPATEGEEASGAHFPAAEGEESSEAHFPEAEGEESSEAHFPVSEEEEASEVHFPEAEENLTPVLAKEVLPNTDDFFEAMDVYKKTFLNEVKNEIRNAVRTEVVEEVKKEISKGTYYTVKSISDSIYKSNENTKAELQELTESIDRATEVTVEKYKSLEETVTSQSFETAEEIFTLSKQLSETSEELSHYIDVTNNEIQGLSETLEKDREYYAEEREQFRQEIKQREIAFQSMLSSFRDAAGAKEKKWWKFW